MTYATITALLRILEMLIENLKMGVKCENCAEKGW